MPRTARTLLFLFTVKAIHQIPRGLLPHAKKNQKLIPEAPVSFTPFICYMDTKEKAEQKETTIPNPHDVFAKEMLSYKQNAVDFFGGILPGPLQKNLDLQTIGPDKTAYSDEKLKRIFLRRGLFLLFPLRGSHLQTGTVVRTQKRPFRLPLRPAPPLHLPHLGPAREAKTAHPHRAPHYFLSWRVGLGAPPPIFVPHGGHGIIIGLFPGLNICW